MSQPRPIHPFYAYWEVRAAILNGHPGGSGYETKPTCEYAADNSVNCVSVVGFLFVCNWAKYKMQS